MISCLKLHTRTSTYLEPLIFSQLGSPNDNLLLLDWVNDISKLGNIALVLNLVLALDHSDLRGLDDTNLRRGRVNKATGDIQKTITRGTLSTWVWYSSRQTWYSPEDFTYPYDGLAS